MIFKVRADFRDENVTNLRWRIQPGKNLYYIVVIMSISISEEPKIGKYILEGCIVCELDLYLKFILTSNKIAIGSKMSSKFHRGSVTILAMIFYLIVIKIDEDKFWKPLKFDRLQS